MLNNTPVVSTIIEKTPKWYVVYTRPRHEKKFSENLDEIGITNYLPLFKTLKQWSDRKKMVEEPFFKSYVFVKIGLKDYEKVTKTSGYVSFVKFGMVIESVPQRQIDMIKYILGSDSDAKVDNSTYILGDKVQIIRGNLIGLIGYLIEIQGKHKILINIDVINQNIVVSVPIGNVIKLDENADEDVQWKKFRKRFS